MISFYPRDQRKLSPFLFLFWLLIFACGCSNRTHGKDCSWNNCPSFPKTGSINDDVINVHLICHSHDDLGWIINVDEYFSRLRPRLIPASVEHIYNTVLIELERDPEKKFSFAETGFLTRWIESHGKKDYKRFQKLVANGQIELIGGGWVQPDEAASHYVEIIDQYTLGLRKLNESYGECGRPKIAWQIDPFGHSREHANIAVGIGYEALFFARMHYLEHDARVKNKSLEFVWSTSDDFNENQILTGQFYSGDYGPPPGYCFDIMCADDPIVDAPQLQGYNIDAKVDELIKYIKKQVEAQKHRNVMLMMGSDFHYTDANMIYTNIDKLIKAANSRSNQTKITFRYSTPSCYVKSLTSASPHLPQRTDDFFPYASGNHSYWTGYFTSKPVMKGLVRSSSAFLQLVRFFDTFALSSKNENNERIEKFERAVALSQHHDAVTGTSKENVTQDYENRLTEGWKKGEESLKRSFSKLSALKENETLPQQTICLLSNESICLLTKSNKKLAFTVYNGYSQSVSTVVRIPYYSQVADINGPKGEAVPFEIVKAFIPKNQLTSNDSAEYEIHLPVELPALGFKTFFLNQNNKTNKLEKTVFGEILSRNFRGKKLKSRYPREISGIQKLVKESPAAPLAPSIPTNLPTKISNGLIELTFDENGRLSTFKNMKTNFTRELSQQFYYYESVKRSKQNPQASGAYIFRPVMIADTFDGNVSIEIIKGKYIQEVRQTINEWVTQTIRLISNQNYIEFDWIVGPIFKEEKNATGREIISRYSVKGLKNNGIFYTDSNGRQLIKRIRNSAEFYTFEKTEPISGNYYPIPSRIIISDDKTQLSILTDRSQGGTSLTDGNVELMLHRRMYDDDSFGVEEPLDEPGNDKRGLVARGRQWLILEPKTKNSQKEQRKSAMELFHFPIISYAPITSQSKYRSIALTEFSGLYKSLPENIHLLTLKQLSPSQILLRLEHYLQNGEDGILAQPATINLAETFSTLTILSLEELNLAGTTKMKEMPNRPKSWNRSSRIHSIGGFTVQLNPMEIKTFLVEARFKSPKN
uniref:Alpha-mannosidase n=1 Tax=Panagrolaimus sp. PS1159 TaxID=55785 RepID=A0AC35FAW4_9BILA